jgi:hypothetical protein
MRGGWLGHGAMGRPWRRGRTRRAAGSLAFPLAVTRLSPRRRTARYDPRTDNKATGGR